MNQFSLSVVKGLLSRPKALVSQINSTSLLFGCPKTVRKITSSFLATSNLVGEGGDLSGEHLVLITTQLRQFGVLRRYHGIECPEKVFKELANVFLASNYASTIEGALESEIVTEEFVRTLEALRVMVVSIYHMRFKSECHSYNKLMDEVKSRGPLWLSEGYPADTLYYDYLKLRAATNDPEIEVVKVYYRSYFCASTLVVNDEFVVA